MLNAEQTFIHERALLISKNFKRTEIELIDILQLVRQKKIFLGLGYSSLFVYATECLGLSPANAYTYTKIAKTAESIPELKEEIKKGTLTVTNARRIVPILTETNKAELLEKATHLKTKDLEKVVAAIHPEPVRESIRTVSFDRLSLKLGITEEIAEKLKRAQVLLSNQKRRPTTIEEVLEASLDRFLEKSDPVRKAEKRTTGKLKDSQNHSEALPSPDDILVSRPKPVGGIVRVAKRTPIPARLRHQIFQRDQGKCAYRRADGTKCGSSHFIEIHHRKEVSKGGKNELSNLVTLCGAHHGYVHLRSIRIEVQS